MDFLLKEIGANGEAETVVLVPEPAFVIKSKITGVHQQSNKSYQIKDGLKIFINLCYDKQVPKPDVDFNPNIVYPLIMNNKWEIPIVTSTLRTDIDKKGNECYVCDCCINTECVKWIAKDLQLREILIEWCLESCEIREALEISRDHIAFPNMKNKGDSIPTIEVLQEELTTDFNKEILKSLKNEESTDPVNIIKMKRDLINEDDDGIILNSDGSLPPLFPQTFRNHADKPLIQEINDINIKKLENNQDKGIILNKKDVFFDVSIRKTKINTNYKLKIEIKTNIESSLDLSLQYVQKRNDLILSNINLIEYKPQKVNIPLPNIFDKDHITNSRVVFVNSEKKLFIFL